MKIKRILTATAAAALVITSVFAGISKKYRQKIMIHRKRLH